MLVDKVGNMIEVTIQNGKRGKSRRAVAEQTGAQTGFRERDIEYPWGFNDRSTYVTSQTREDQIKLGLAVLGTVPALALSSHAGVIKLAKMILGLDYEVVRRTK